MPIVDIFLADPIVTSMTLPPFDPGSLRFVYRLELEDEMRSERELLEETFRIFNIDHPEDYRERSLSVGDVVTIAECRSYRCDSLGWEKLECPLLMIDSEKITGGRHSENLVLVDELESHLTASAGNGSGVDPRVTQSLLLSITDRRKRVIFPCRSRIRAAFTWLRWNLRELCRWFAQLLYGS